MDITESESLISYNDSRSDFVIKAGDKSEEGCTTTSSFTCGGYDWVIVVEASDCGLAEQAVVDTYEALCED